MLFFGLKKGFLGFFFFFWLGGGILMFFNNLFVRMENKNPFTTAPLAVLNSKVCLSETIMKGGEYFYFKTKLMSVRTYLQL